MAYQVVYLHQALEQFRRLHEEARKKGWGLQVLLAGQEVHEALRSDPVGFGDPIFHFRELHLQILTRCRSPIFLEYGVHETQPVVFVRRFTVAPGIQLE